jgi:DDE superfamily endonuclease
MLTLPDDIITVLAAFAPLFTGRTFAHVQVLLIGTILTPGRRTVTAALRAMGLAHEKHFQNYHRVLNRAQWSSRQAARTLLGLLTKTFVPCGPLVLGIDETLERRRGDKIAAKGIYRDSARSSHSFFVKSSGLRWISLMLLCPIPWAGRVWALPFLTVLAPSERYHQERKRRHKKLTDWARQMLTQVRRWLPDRTLVVVADSGYAVLTLLDRCRELRCRQPVTMITRLRLDAGLYEPAPERSPGQIGRPRKKGKRLPTLERRLDDTSTIWTQVAVARWYSQGERQIEFVSQTAVWYHSGMPPVPIRWVLIRDPQANFAPQALLCTDLEAAPVQIVSWFVQRWQVESTFQQVRTHLGVETQRQWNEQAIARTTPALLGLFSLVTLMAHPHMRPQSARQAAWYVKEAPTFSDALALVRRRLWRERFCLSLDKADTQKLRDAFRMPWLEPLTEALCYAA